MTTFASVFAKGAVATAPVVGAPTLLAQTESAEIEADSAGGHYTFATFTGGTAPYTVVRQSYLNGGWLTTQTATRGDGEPIAAYWYLGDGQTVRLRHGAASAGSTQFIYTPEFTLTGVAAPTLPPASFGGPADYVYPTLPAVGSTTAAGQLVVRVTTLSQLRSNALSNRYVIVADGTYWDGSTTIINAKQNLTIIAENRLGARIAAPSYGNVNGIHVTNCDDFAIIGIDFAKTGYYSMRFGGDNLNYPSSPFGPNRRVKILGCRFRDLTTGALKIDNGYGNGSASPYISTDFEIGWCEFSKTGQAPPSTNLDFSEGIYMGDGTYPYYQRVDNINIHHCLIDGTDMLTGSGEAIEAKVYVSNLRVADTEIRNWQLADSTSGGALALSINRGTNISPNVVPNNGDRGYLIERCFIHGTRLRSGSLYAKASAISLGHGNTVIRNCVLANNASGGLIFVNNTNTHTGIFSNPAQLRVDVLHNTIVGNGSLGQYGANWAADPALTPAQYFAQVYSRNNILSGAPNYFANQGVTWLAQQDAWNVIASQVGGSFTTDDVTAIKPGSDGSLVSGVDAGVSTDLLGNPRPSGQRQFGAIEVQV